MWRATICDVPSPDCPELPIAAAAIAFLSPHSYEVFSRSWRTASFGRKRGSFPEEMPVSASDRRIISTSASAQR